MNPFWSPLRQDTLFDPSAYLLEQPSVLRPEHSSLRHDTLNASALAAQSTALFPSAEPKRPTSPEAHEPQDVAQPVERQLKTLRNSPGFRLIADSALFLKACQLDMDFPPTRQDYVRQQLITLLLQKVARRLTRTPCRSPSAARIDPLWTITATNATASACR